MKWIVGLGNPGPQYAGTRHNIGFQVIEVLAKRRGVRMKSLTASAKEVIAACGEYRLGGQILKLLMPLTWMNNSGEALRGRIESPQDVLVVYDEVQLPLGKLRMRPQGGDGGHHGLASCLEVLQTQEVARLRVGVGIDPLPQDLTDFVLSPFSKEERPIIERMVEQAADACEIWATQGIDVAMNRYN